MDNSWGCAPVFTSCGAVPHCCYMSRGCAPTLMTDIGAVPLCHTEMTCMLLVTRALDTAACAVDMVTMLLTTC